MRSKVISAALGVVLATSWAMPASAGKPMLAIRAVAYLQVYKVDPASGSMERVTDSDSSKGVAAWSPDRSLIAYSASKAASESVHIVERDGSNDRKVADLGMTSFAWSPDGRTLLGVARYSIWKIVVKTGRHWKLADGKPDRAYAGPVWSPGGNRIIFIRRNTAGETDLMEMQSNGAAKEQLHGVDVLPRTSPDFSPSGKRLVFAAHSGQASDIFTLGRGGAGLRQLTDTDKRREEGPDWGPDGIAFRRGPDEYSGHVCWMTSTGRATECGNHSASFPHWGPGGRIAYTKMRNERWDGIFTVRTDGTTRRVTENGLITDW